MTKYVAKSKSSPDLRASVNFAQPSTTLVLIIVKTQEQ